MDVFIDNKNLEDYGITVLDYTGALSFPAERENERTWQDKSGVDPNLVNPRYDAKEFVLKCVVKADNEAVAYNQIKVLIEDMFVRGAVVLSLRDTERSIRECFICERSNTIVADINIRQQNSLYVFRLGLKDINPNAVKYKTTIVGNSVTIAYTKGQTAVIYWGNGDIAEVSNSGDYAKDDYAADGLVDIIIDVDSDADNITALAAEFSADVVAGEKPLDVQFTDGSTGTPVIWSWNFGDGTTSDESSPLHTYEEQGIYTVTFQIFNDAAGSDVETKIDYITVVRASLLESGTDRLLVSDDVNDYLLIN